MFLRQFKNTKQYTIVYIYMQKGTARLEFRGGRAMLH